jgi:molecular chaperone HtpG
VADKLAEMFQKDRKDFEEKWNDLYLFVQYGMLSDEKFAEKAKSFALVKNTEGSFFTMEEYLEKIKALQTNKSEEQIVLYTSDAEGQFSYVKQAKDRGYDVLVLDGPLASHWIQKLEQQQEKVRFSRVDSDSLDKLIDKGEEIPSKLSKSEEEKLKPLFEEAVNKEKYTVQLESMPESEAPILITQPEFIRRMMEQQRMGGGGFYGAFPEMYQLVINENHPVMSKLLKMKSPRQKETVKQLVDLAMLSQGLLKGEALTDFIHRSVNGMVES